MLRLIKTPAHQHPSNGGEPQREWTKGKRSPRALPAEGPISIRRELILTGHSHSNRSSQGEEELMWLPYWLLLLLSFRSLPTWRSGLGVSIDQIGLWLTCVLLHAASRQELVEATGFVKKKKKRTNRIRGENVASNFFLLRLHLSFSGMALQIRKRVDKNLRQTPINSSNCFLYLDIQSSALLSDPIRRGLV